jgi:hypothetical protein
MVMRNASWTSLNKRVRQPGGIDVPQDADSLKSALQPFADFTLQEKGTEP